MPKEIIQIHNMSPLEAKQKQPNQQKKFVVTLGEQICIRYVLTALRFSTSMYCESKLISRHNFCLVFYVNLIEISTV